VVKSEITFTIILAISDNPILVTPLRGIHQMKSSRMTCEEWSELQAKEVFMSLEMAVVLAAAMSRTEESAKVL